MLENVQILLLLSATDIAVILSYIWIFLLKSDHVDVVQCCYITSYLIKSIMLRSIA